MANPQYGAQNPAMAGLQKYASMTSVHSMTSLGYLPPGHGYVPRRQKPDKPYGLTFYTIMNRTWRGPGRKYLQYAGVCASLALLFFSGAALYFGLRNVSRMIVMRTEVLGALLVAMGICMVAIMGKLLYKARVESNRWRSYIRFRPEGMNTAITINSAYVPETQETDKLKSGTYGKKALREIPKPKYMKKKAKSKSGSKSSLLTPTQTHPQGFVFPPPQQTSSPTGTLLPPQPGRQAPQGPAWGAEKRQYQEPQRYYPGQQYPMQEMTSVTTAPLPAKTYRIEDMHTGESEL